MTWEKFFTDPSMVALMVGALVALMVAYLWQRDPTNEFDLRDLFLDTTTRRMSPEKTAIMVALTVSTWGFVSQIQDGNMTEFYFTGYIAAWGLSRAVSQGVTVWRDKGKSPDKDASP